MPAKLTVTRGKRMGAEFALEGKAVFDLGSASSALLRFDEPGVAANHCRIFREEKRFTIFDLCGLGVAVNGQRVARSELKHGDEIVIGQVKFRFDDPQAAGSGGGGGGATSIHEPQASLQCIEGADKNKVWKLTPDKTSFTVGRGMSAEVVVLDIKCSREHCRVERRADGYYLVDLGSTNGTKINGRKVKANSTTKLSPGDQLKLGFSVLALRLEGELVPLPETTKMTGATEGVVTSAQPLLGSMSASAIASAPPPPPPPTTKAPSTKTTSSFPNAKTDVEVDFDFLDAPTEPATRPASAAPPHSADPEEAAEASLRTFVFDDQPAFEPAPTKPDKPAAKAPEKPAPAKPAVEKPAPPPPEKKTSAPPPAAPVTPAAKAPADKPKGSDPWDTHLFEEEFKFDERPPSDEAPAHLAATNVEDSPPPPGPRETRLRAEEGEDAAVRSFVFEDDPEPQAPPPPPPTPRSTPDAVRPQDVEGEDAAFRTFVFDDGADFAEKAPPPAPPPPKPAAAPKAPPAPTPRPATKDLDGEDAALRTFVFDDGADFADKPETAPPPPPPKPAAAPKATSAPKAPPAPTPRPATKDLDGEDAALRTFVFDDGADFADKPENAPPPAPPPPKPAAAPKASATASAAKAPPPPKAPATPPKASPKDLDGEDAALRTFVFDDGADFDDAKGPKAPPSKPALRMEDTDLDTVGSDESDEAPDPALRTFVFDEAPAFEDAPPPPAAPPPPPARPKGTTARYDAPDEDEASDAALRTFVFDDAPTFDGKGDSDEKASLRRVDVEVPDLDAPPPPPAPRPSAKPPAPAKPTSAKPAAPSKPATPSRPVTPAAANDDDGEREQFKTQFLIGEAAPKPADEDDEDGEQFHAMVFDKPPEF